jgi:acyl-CoA synthetase (AMP-forming)/AMP-acid ligase II
MKSLGCDLVSFAFHSQVRVNRRAPLYIDASCPSRSLNATQTRTLVRKLIAGFRNAGLKRGDRVVVHLFNNVRVATTAARMTRPWHSQSSSTGPVTKLTYQQYLYSALFLAIIGAGGVYVGSNPAYQLFEIDHLLQLAEPTLIITSPDLLPHVLEATKTRDIKPTGVYCLDPPNLDVPGQTIHSPASSRRASFEEYGASAAGIHDLEALLAYGESDWIRLPNEKSAKATPAAYFTTSGTSGLPKAAILSHAAMRGQHECIIQNVPYQVKRLMCLPSFHILGCLFTHIFPIRYGEPLYIQARFKLDDYINAIQRFKITDTIMSPPMVFAINRSTLPIQQMLQSIRYIACGGERLTSEPQQEFYKHLSPDAIFSQVWGMTEIGAVTLFKYPEKDFSASVGRILPGCEIKLVDSTGATINEDEKFGEAYVRTKNVMTGYKNMTPAQSCLGEDGWVATGDVMSMKDGKCYVKGRSKELIKVKGQVIPSPGHYRNS